MNLLNKIIRKTIRARSETVLGRIFPYLNKSSKIIDIGSGTGDIALLLRKRGKDITPLDVADFHGIRVVETTIYDGIKIPFPDKSFDTALLLMVMHHTPNPEIILKEAARVSDEIVVIETSYTTPVSKWVTVIADTVGNLRLNAFWSSYKTDSEWQKLFKKHNLAIIESHKYQDRNLGFPFLHIFYYLKDLK